MDTQSLATLSAGPITLRPDQIAALGRWLNARRKAPGWLDGYGLGRSYVDTRVRSGVTNYRRRAYVKLDHATARIVPELAGWSGAAVAAFLKAAEGNPDGR